MIRHAVARRIRFARVKPIAIASASTPTLASWLENAVVACQNDCSDFTRRSLPAACRGGGRGIAVQGVSQTGTGVVAQGAVGVAAEASGVAVQAIATGAGATAVSAAAEQGTAVRAWSESSRALDARSETVDAAVRHRRPRRRRGVVGAGDRRRGQLPAGPNPLGIFRSGVLGPSDTYPGVIGRSDSGDGVEAVTAERASPCAPTPTPAAPART